ncbi:unnamed protein product [Cyprideis torosa]|uniref:Uncharacterized protein n=1 Tax=Cyprideis torosa TaxID=163714 RepID=A0A7R8WF03_9CRUS|nr:unnamed protein product [Cyprideis torosa]CAG0890362.1 unnamed protein product [Cyprideis torosa]
MECSITPLRSRAQLLQSIDYMDDSPSGSAGTPLQPPPPPPQPPATAPPPPTIVAPVLPPTSITKMEPFNHGLSLSPPCVTVGPHSAPPSPSPGSFFRQISTGPSVSMRYRNLGKSGLKVSRLGLATWATFSPSVSEEQAEAVVTLAYEAGINLFDTSEVYSGGLAEYALGTILKRKGWKRSTYHVATKIFWGRAMESELRGLSRKGIIESLRSSLERLQLEYVDIVILHRADPKCPMEEIVRAMNYCIQQGWAMYWGTSRWTPVEIMEAYTNCRTFNCVTPIVEQMEYHFFCREKTELHSAELYNKIGVGCMTWSPLGAGLILGNCEPGMPRFARASFRSLRDKQGELLDVAQRLGCTLSQLTLAWSLKNDHVQCVLLGATSAEQFIENLASLCVLPKLVPAVMGELEKIIGNKPVRPPMVSTLQLQR